MASTDSYSPDLVSQKIIVTGPPGSGKTAFVGAAADQAPLRTIEHVQTAAGRDRLLSLELGYVEVAARHRLALITAPLPRADGVLWADMTRGALGAVVLARPECPEAAFPAIERLEEARVPYQLAINHLPGTAPDPAWASQVLEVSPARVTVCDARSRTATRNTIGDVVRRALDAYLEGGDPCAA